MAGSGASLQEMKADTTPEHSEAASATTDTASPGGVSRRSARRWSLIREHVHANAAARTVRNNEARARGESIGPNDIWRNAMNVALQQVQEIREARSHGTQNWESINYTTADNATKREEMRGYGEHDSSRTQKWVLVIVMMVGLLTGLVTVALLKFVEFVHVLKTNAFMKTSEHGSLGVTWVLVAVPNMVLFGAAAAVNAYWKPTAAGSGIPEVKAYLNGIMLPGAFTKETFVAKFVSCALACATGLPIGPEGPIIYLGGNMGQIFTSKRFLAYLPRVAYTNKLQRMAMTLGVAAGVSAAFGAPIGAVLFTVEEVSSLFTTSLLWVGFICSFMSYFVTIILGRGLFGGNSDEWSTAGMFATGSMAQWQPQEIPLYIIFGALLGLLAVLFNVVNVYLINATYRKRFINIPGKTHRKVVEVVIAALVISTLWLFLPHFVSCIGKEKSFPGDASTMPGSMREATNSLFCDDTEKEYNPLATLLFGSLDDQVKFLMMPQDDHDPFPVHIVLIYATLFFAASCFIAGCAMSTGLFIPMIIIGAAFGKCYGMALAWLLPGYVKGGIEVAAYAVVGASGFVSGVTHITLSIVVILLEISNDLRLLMPLMLVTGVAKFVANHFTESLYDMLLENKHIPFLEPEPNVAMMRLRCFQVMKKPVVALPHSIKVGDLLHMIIKSTHNGFPVVDAKSGNNRVLGLVSRGHLETILDNIDEFVSWQKARTPSEPNPPLPPSAGRLSNHHRGMMSSWKVDKSMRKWQALSSSMSEETRNFHLDLDHWMDRQPVTIRMSDTVERAFHFIKAFGLRQLPVVNADNGLVGILARHDIFHVQHHPEKYEQQASAHVEDFRTLRRVLGDLTPGHDAHHQQHRHSKHHKQPHMSSARSSVRRESGALLVGVTPKARDIAAAADPAAALAAALQNGDCSDDRPKRLSVNFTDLATAAGGDQSAGAAASSSGRDPLLPSSLSSTSLGSGSGPEEEDDSPPGQPPVLPAAAGRRQSLGPQRRFFDFLADAYTASPTATPTQQTTPAQDNTD